MTGAHISGAVRDHPARMLPRRGLDRWAKRLASFH
jgi:hypothetical protein